MMLIGWHLKTVAAIAFYIHNFFSVFLILSFLSLKLCISTSRRNVNCFLGNEESGVKYLDMVHTYIYFQSFKSLFHVHKNNNNNIDILFLLLNSLILLKMKFQLKCFGVNVHHIEI